MFPNEQTAAFAGMSLRTWSRCAVFSVLAGRCARSDLSSRSVSPCVALARERLQSSPGDETAQFFLGKMNLNYVWLQLGPLGRKTGWDEYWEARRSLDPVLKRNPAHVRARVACASIDLQRLSFNPFHKTRRHVVGDDQHA